MIVIDLVRACLLILIPTLHTLGWLRLPWLYVLGFVITLWTDPRSPAMQSVSK